VQEPFGNARGTEREESKVPRGYRKFKCVAKTLGLSVREDIERPVLRGFSDNRVASTGTVNIHVRVGEASARLRVVVVNDD
jgi:hypothetical protein